MASSKANLGRPKGAKLEGLKQVASCRIKEMTGPKSKHKANKWLLPILAFCSMLGVVFSIGGITLAAYLNALQVENQVKVDFSDLGQYFSGQITEETNEEGIRTRNIEIRLPEELISLQKLNAIGIFGPEDTFYLTQDLTWDSNGPALNPIGTEEVPFDSTFDGRGHTISGLQVESYDSSDVGMFGYTSVNSTIKNLILQSPVINVKASVKESGFGSPAEPIYQTAAANLPDISFTANDGNHVYIHNPDDASQPATIAGFRPNATISDGENQVAVPLIYESSDPDIIALDYGSDGQFAGTAQCFSNSDYAAEVTAVTITAKARYSIGEEFGYYVLERYQFNVLGTGRISTSTTTVDNNGVSETYNTGAFKTIHSAYRPHGYYVGFFIGHCDGYANHLGLEGGNSHNQSSNGRIVVDDRSRTTVYSASSLIGLSRMDNPLDSSAGDTMRIVYQFDSLPGEKDFSEDETNGGQTIPGMKVRDIERGYTDVNAAYGSGYSQAEINSIYQTTPNPDSDFSGTITVDAFDPDLKLDKDSNQQTANAESITSRILPSGMMEYSKIWPGTNQEIVATNLGQSSFPVSSNWEKINYKESDNPNDLSFTGQVLDGGLGAGTMTKVTHGIYNRTIWVIVGTLHETDNFYYRMVRGIYAQNAFSIWATKNFTSYFDENGFDVNIDISYVATRDLGTEANQNSFQMLYNAYNPEVKGQAGWTLGGYTSANGPQDGWRSSYAQMLFWQDMSRPYDKNFELTEAMYNPDDHPIIDDGQLHEDTITIEFTQENAGLISNIWDALFGDSDVEQRYPMMLLGIGSNTATDGENMRFYSDIYQGQNRTMRITSDDYTFDSNSQDGRTHLKNYIFFPTTSDWWPDWLGDNSRGYQAYRINTNESTSFGEDDNAYNNRERGYFNSYFEVENGTKVYIRDIDVTFTNRVGNTESIVYNVDYIDSTTSAPVFDEATETFDSWPIDSNVQVVIDMDSTNGSVDFDFYRTGNEVHGYYSSANYPLQNADTLFGNDAVLTQG